LNAAPRSSAPRPPNGFLSSLNADDFELIRPHLRTVDLTTDLVLVEVDDTLKRAYLPHRGVISLVVKLARGEQVQVAMIGRDSIFGSFSALGDPIALNSALDDRFHETCIMELMVWWRIPRLRLAKRGAGSWQDGGE
jgi:CRP-like cAMP-binding protein